MAEDPAHQLVWALADVVDNHGYGRPPAFLQAGRLHTVVFPALGVRMPLDTVVFSDDLVVRPGKVNPPSVAVEVGDFVLQFRQWQPSINEDEPCLALHRKLGTTVGKLHEFADMDDASS